MNEKTRFPRTVGLQVARELCLALQPVTSRLIVAGSLRRGKAMIGDVELLFIPSIAKDQPVPGDLFRLTDVDLAAAAIARLEKEKVLARRQNCNGSDIYGPKNKLMVHVATGLPVDLFATVEASWWNYLVCRTGPAESNTRIASAARDRGWQWNPYGPGFTHPASGKKHVVTSEEDVFAFVGLPYFEPKDRR